MADCHIGLRGLGCLTDLEFWADRFTLEGYATKMI